MAVSLSVETLNWHCPPWGGLVHGPSYDRQAKSLRQHFKVGEKCSRCSAVLCQAVTPGIVHIGLTEFHRAHQAHFIDEFLSSGQAGVSACHLTYHCTPERGSWMSFVTRQVDCLSWGISGVSFAEDQHLHHASLGKSKDIRGQSSCRSALLV